MGDILSVIAIHRPLTYHRGWQVKIEDDEFDTGAHPRRESAHKESH